MSDKSILLMTLRNYVKCIEMNKIRLLEILLGKGMHLKLNRLSINSLVLRKLLREYSYTLTSATKTVSIRIWVFLDSIANKRKEKDN